MLKTRTARKPPPELMYEVSGSPVRRARVVAAMVAIGLVGPLVGIALQDDDFDRGFITVALLWNVAIALVAAALCLRRPSPREVGRFVSLHRIALTTRNGALIVDYLARTRRWRAYGVLASLSVGQVVTSASPDTEVNVVALLFVGWFAAGILAELPVGPRHVGGVRVANLQPRTLAMYLSPGVATWLAGWAVATVGLLIAYGSLQSPLGTGRVVGGFAVLTVLTSLSLWSMLVIVRRPQPAAPADVVVADDATRRAAIGRVAGGWGVLQCIVTMVVGQWLSSSSVSDLANNFGYAFFLLGGFGVLGSWLAVPTTIAAPPARPHGPAIP